MQCSRLLYPFAWLPTSAKHHGQEVTRLSDFENAYVQTRSSSFHVDELSFCISIKNFLLEGRA